MQKCFLFESNAKCFLFKSNARSLDCHIGLADFFFAFFSRKMTLNALITTDVHSYILMHL